MGGNPQIENLNADILLSWNFDVTWNMIQPNSDPT